MRASDSIEDLLRGVTGSRFREWDHCRGIVDPHKGDQRLQRSFANPSPIVTLR